MGARLFLSTPKKSPGRDRGSDVTFQRGNGGSLTPNRNPAKSGIKAGRVPRAVEEEAPDERERRGFSLEEVATA
jgi:hypothetical protein